MLPAGGFAEPFGIDKSSRPWRQILPQAKFPRQLYLHPAVTYVYVSSLGCKHSFLVLRAFSTLCQSVDFVNILRSPGRKTRRAIPVSRLPAKRPCPCRHEGKGRAYFRAAYVRSATSRRGLGDALGVVKAPVFLLRGADAREFLAVFGRAAASPPRAAV